MSAKPGNRTNVKVVKYIIAMAIVIIIIFLLFYVPGDGESTIYGCKPTSEFLCQNTVIKENGTVSLNLEQYSGSTMYDVQIACTVYNYSARAPIPLSAFEWLNDGNLTGTSVAGLSENSMLNSGQMILVHGLPCYANSAVVNKQSYGLSYFGTVWLNYTTTPNQSSITNPWRTVSVANFFINFT